MWLLAKKKIRYVDKNNMDQSFYFGIVPHAFILGPVQDFF